jgi:hypothetical protein
MAAVPEFRPVAAEVRTHDPAKTVALLAAISLVLALWLPVLSGNDAGGGSAGSLADGGSEFVAYVLISVALMLIGIFAMPRGSTGAALAGGAGTAVGGVFGFMSALVISLLNSFGDFGDIKVGPGLVFICISFGLCFILFWMVVARRDSTAPRVHGPHTALGVLSALGMSLGVMLPPSGSGVSFKDMNFDLHPGYVQAGYLLLVGSIALPGLIGFAAQTAWGALFALGGLVPTLWLVLMALSDNQSTNSFAYSLDKVHPVLLIAVGLQIVSLIMFRVAMNPATRAPRLDPVPVSREPDRATPAFTAAGPQRLVGRWDTDPFGRHQHRYHDGRSWTAQVSDDGVTANDPPGFSAPTAPN